MGQRGQALWRIWAFIWSITVGAILVGVIGLIGIIWGVIDVLWQLISGKNTLNENSRPATIVYETLMWDIHLLVFALLGRKQFRWLPDW